MSEGGVEAAKKRAKFSINVEADRKESRRMSVQSNSCITSGCCKAVPRREESRTAWSKALNEDDFE